MKKIKRQALSVLLTLAMLASVLPAGAVSAQATENVTYVNADGTTQTCSSATDVASDVTNWNNGWYVVSDSFSISERITVTGDVHLILADGAILTANQGVEVSAGNSLTIYGQQNGSGRLTVTNEWGGVGIGVDGAQGDQLGDITINGGTVNVTGSSGDGLGGGRGGISGSITINGGTVTATGYYGGAGIGGSSQISINGGTVEATGNDGGAGIGGGNEGNGNIITINGGTVNATGNGGGAGIGGGNEGDGGSITIEGGTVNATGNGGGAGIGGGNDGDSGSITINGATVTATSNDGGAGIGGGKGGYGDIINIIGGTVSATGNGGGAGIGGTLWVEGQNTVIIASSISNWNSETSWHGLVITQTNGAIYGIKNFTIKSHLTIPSGYTLSIDPDQTLTIASGTTLTNEGTINNSGTINGTITNNGTINYDSEISVSVEGATKNDDGSYTIPYGSDNISFTATVEPDSSAEFDLPENSVTFSLDDHEITATEQEDGSYKAQFDISEAENSWLPATTHTLSATFSGVTATNGVGLLESTSEITITVVKGTQPAPNAPTMASNTTTSITLLGPPLGSPGSGDLQFGYTVGNGAAEDIANWQTGTTFSGLKPGTAYTFYARYGENGLYAPSPASIGNIFYTLPEITTTALPTGNVGAAYEATLTATVGEGVDVTWTATDLPDGLRIDEETGVISGTPTAVVDAQPVTITATIGNDSDNASNQKNFTLTVNKSTQSTPAAPTMASRTTTSITLNAIATSGHGAVQYACVEGASGSAPAADSTAWTTDPVFTGLKSGTAYTFFARYAGDDTYAPAISAATTITTLAEPDPTPTPNPEPEGPSTDGSDGWTDILDELADAEDGGTVTIDMGETTEVPAEIFEEIAGKDITVEFELGDGLSWTVNGTDIPANADLTDLDLGVSMDTDGIPVNVINAITGEVGTVQITLAYDGAFGFTMTLTAPLGAEHAGYWANLYHYNEDAEAMTFESAALVDEDGNVQLPFSHASQFAIVLDDHSHASVSVSEIFTDVPANHWAIDAIQYVYDHDLMTGTSAAEFSPELATTRGMLVSILYRLEGNPDISEEILGYPYADVTADDWYSIPVYWARLHGIAAGFDDNTFHPNDPLTREQLASMLMNYARWKGQEVSARADLSHYSDADRIGSWASDTMRWAVACGLISGMTNDTLQPQGAATRAQLAAILQRFLAE